MPEVLSVDRVLRIAEAGEAFTLNGAAVPLKDLIAIATAARRSRGMVRFCGLTGRPLEDLMQITVASQGRVIIVDDEPAGPARQPRRRSWLPLRRTPSPAAIHTPRHEAKHA
jgi:hypothetical protein